MPKSAVQQLCRGIKYRQETPDGAKTIGTERLLPKSAVQRGCVGISNTDREKRRIVES